MKAIHLTAYGNPAQNLVMVEVSEPNAPSASEALVRMLNNLPVGQTLPREKLSQLRIESASTRKHDEES